MKDWVNLGGQNSGCCGDANHKYGFHRPAWDLTVNDYSRANEPGRPYNMGWACAGDFSHGGTPRLRAMHLALLQRLMAGEHPMICEFIGQPWPDRPVYYWARWLGNKTLQRYTGSGHDHWSHISWWRSKANQRAHLWVPDTSPATPAAATKPGTVPPKFAGDAKKSATFNANVRIWQAQLAALGWTITPDGYFGDRTLKVVRDFQRLKKIPVSGVIDTATWNAAWTK